MVEHRRERCRALSLRAGPSEVDNVTLSDVNLRIHARAARTTGRQLAEIGDRLDREWAERLPNQWPVLQTLHVTRPPHTLTRSIYRGIQGQLWGVKSLPGVAKAWLASAVHRQATQRAEAWVSSIQPANCPGWAKATLATVALVATATICTALWKE
uniref:BCL2 interacting killer n=1 Tax=Salmo trutta TaxID=8032 RepID=A0A674DDX6_SALTR